MTEVFIYALVGSLLFLFSVVAHGERRRRHEWYEVDSARVAMLTRKSKEARRK